MTIQASPPEASTHSPVDHELRPPRRRPIITLQLDTFDDWWTDGQGWDFVSPEATWPELYDEPAAAAVELISISGRDCLTYPQGWVADALPIYFDSGDSGIILTVRHPAWVGFQLATPWIDAATTELASAFQDRDRTAFPKYLVNRLNGLLDAAAPAADAVAFGAALDRY